MTSASVGPYFRFRRSRSTRRSSTSCSRAGRRVDVFGIAAQEKREVLQLRLDGLPRFEVWRHARVEGRQVGDAPPDGGECAQDGTVRLVERRIRLAAQPLQLLGVRQHLPLRPPAPRLRPACSPCPRNLVALEREQVERAALLSFVEPQRVAFGPERLKRENASPTSRAIALQARVVVEQTQMTVGIQQALVLMLPVESRPAGPTKSRNAPAVTSAPLTNARLRPCAVTSRRSTTSCARRLECASTCREFRAGAHQIARRARRPAGARRPRPGWIFRHRSRPSARSDPASNSISSCSMTAR